MIHCHEHRSFPAFAGSERVLEALIRRDSLQEARDKIDKNPCWKLSAGMTIRGGGESDSVDECLAGRKRKSGRSHTHHAAATFPGIERCLNDAHATSPGRREHS